MRRYILALVLILIGAVGGVLLNKNRGAIDSGVIGFLLLLPSGLLFANGVYGLLSGRVWGRTWEKYWGGWCYREEEPSVYWTYTLTHLLVGAFGLAFFLMFFL